MRIILIDPNLFLLGRLLAEDQLNGEVLGHATVVFHARPVVLEVFV